MTKRLTRRSLLAALLAGCCLFFPAPPAPAQSEGEGGEQPAPALPYIFIAATDGSGVRFVTQGLRPAWSPDGSRIVYHRLGVSGGAHLFMISADGSHDQWLGAGAEPAWSPDGTRIVFTTHSGIARLDLADSSVRTLLLHGLLAGLRRPQEGYYLGPYADLAKPAWSPDGQQVAFEYMGDGDLKPAQVYVMNADGSNPRRLTSIHGIQFAESDPAWSPDGSKIALWSSGFGLATIDTWDRSATTLYSGSPAVVHGAKPSWSPDGSLIAFVVNAAPADERAIWVVGSDGSWPVELIPEAYDPAWSPDGKSIAFVSDVQMPPDTFPGVTRTASIYERERAHANPLDSRSRFVFYTDGTFDMQYRLMDGSAFGYAGTYARQGSVLNLNFNDDPEPDAIGTFSSDDRVLDVAFDDMMGQADFEDGTYILTVHSPEGPIKEPDEPEDPPPLPAPCAPDCVTGGDLPQDRERREK